MHNEYKIFDFFFVLFCLEIHRHTQQTAGWTRTLTFGGMSTNQNT